MRLLLYVDQVMHGLSDSFHIDMLSHRDAQEHVCSLDNEHVDEGIPHCSSMLMRAGSYSSVDVFTAQALLREKVARCRAMMAEAGCTYLVVPTVMHHYLVSELQAQEDGGSVQFNAHLGKFTNFVNLLGLPAMSVPAGSLPPLQEEVRLLAA